MNSSIRYQVLIKGKWLVSVTATVNNTLRFVKNVLIAAEVL